MWQELNQLWTSLGDAEYLHLLLEPLPLYGVGFGLVFLLVTHLAGEGKGLLLSLLLIGASAASVWPYHHLREEAMPRVLATRDTALVPLIQEQTQRRAAVEWAYYAVAGVAALALVARAGGKGRSLITLTLVGGAALFCLSLWLHKKECEVYHRNIIKYRPPPAAGTGG